MTDYFLSGFEGRTVTEPVRQCKAYFKAFPCLRMPRKRTKKLS